MLSRTLSNPILRHERDVRVIGVAVGSRGRVVARRLRKPLRRVDAVLQMLCAGKCGLHFGGTVLAQGRLAMKGKARTNNAA